MVLILEIIRIFVLAIIGGTLLSYLLHEQDLINEEYSRITTEMIIAGIIIIGMTGLVLEQTFR
jgi:hypothetical protein